MIFPFPTFKKFHVEDRHQVLSITQQFLPYCEYSLVSLLTWYDITVSMLNNNLILKLTSYFDDKTPVYSILGSTMIDETLLAVISHAQKKGHESELIFVPEPVIKALQTPERFIYTEDRDSFDYIVSTEEMYLLAGGRNRTKRQLISQFLKEYPDYTCSILDITNQTTQKEIQSLYAQWRANKHAVHDFLDFEYKTLTKLIPYTSYLDLLCLGIYHDSLLIGFSLAGLVTKPYAIHYYMKSNHLYRGTQTMLNKLTGEYLFKRGYLYLNLESDLGVAGLRHGKMLLHPLSFLRKYTLQIRD